MSNVQQRMPSFQGVPVVGKSMLIAVPLMLLYQVVFLNAPAVTSSLVTTGKHILGSNGCAQYPGPGSMESLSLFLPGLLLYYHMHHWGMTLIPRISPNIWDMVSPPK